MLIRDAGLQALYFRLRLSPGQFGFGRVQQDQGLALLHGLAFFNQHLNHPRIDFSGQRWCVSTHQATNGIQLHQYFFLLSLRELHRDCP